MLKISASSQPRTMSFDLPKELEMVISHFTWLEELTSFMGKSSLELAPDMRGCIMVILEHDDLERKRKEESNDIDARSDTKFGFIASKLNHATLTAYVKDFKKAREDLCETREYLQNMSEPGYQNTLEYFLDAVEWAVGMLEILEEEIVDEAMKAEHLNQGTELRCRWEAFQTDNNPKTKAMAIFMEGCLSAALKINSAKSAEYFVQASKIDPACSVWYHYAYRKTREVRKDKKFPGPPSGEEKRLCEMAFKMRAKDEIVCVLDYAILLKETIWTEPKPVWDSREKDYMRCQQLLEDVVALASKSKGFGMETKAKLYLAEFLVFGKGRKLDQNKGRRLLLECEKELPNDTGILHKVGKMYHVGAFGSKKWKNPRLAEKFYERALGTESCNYPCVMDYLRLLEEEKEYGKMSEMIDNALIFGKKDGRVAKLHAKKGYVIWQQYSARETDIKEKIKACESWIHVLEDFPDFAIEAYNAVYDKSNVIKVLEEMKSRQEYKGKQRIIASFVEELKERIGKESRMSSLGSNVHRGKKTFVKPVVMDRGGSTWTMKSGKGKNGVIKN